MTTTTEMYPATPGWKTEQPETSKCAALAETSRAAILRLRVATAFHTHGELTADEAAAILGESVLAVRPRVSELHKCDSPVLEDIGRRRKNESGHSAAVWRIVRRQQQGELL